MTLDTFFVPKVSGTYADTFTVNGLAALLNEILLQKKGVEGSRKIDITDMGSHFQIKLIGAFQENWIEKLAFFRSPAFYILSNNDDKAPSIDVNTRNVNETWERVRTYAEQWNAFYDQGIRGTDIDAQLQDHEPPHDWTVVAFLGDRRMQAQGIYNRVVDGWYLGRAHYLEHLQTLFQLYNTSDVATNQILLEWRKIAKQDHIPYQDTASQLLNPHQGKGQNESKANALRMDNMKDRPWPEEFLKTCGLWHCLIPRQTYNSKGKKEDWKVYVIAPRHLTFSAQREAYRIFNKYLWREGKGNTTCLKTDITSLLLFYKSWLDYIETTTREQDDFDADIARPERAVNGFYVAQFKLLSQNAYTMINQSFLSLPSWGSGIHTRRDLTETKGLIDEHLEVIHSIEEGHSDGYDLLRRYRDFVAGENWDAFFSFTASYSHHILHRYNEGNRWVSAFSTTLLRRLFMNSNKPLSTILENQGFQNVAAAIRYSTVIPQSRKARQEDNLYDVRYGLGTELKRKATVRDEFVTELTNFMQIYNQENVQKLENKGQQMRKDLRTSDIEEVMQLVDQYGSELVANLLIAYGYAREPREDKENQ